MNPAHNNNNNNALDTQFSQLPHSGSEFGSKLQELCLYVWPRLETHPETMSRYASQLIELLSDAGNLAVVSHVIPELRPGAPAVECSLQRDIMTRIACARSRLHDIDQTDPSTYYKQVPRYEEEQRIFQEAEMYRASLLVQHSGHLSNEQKGRFRAWIDACPIRGPGPTQYVARFKQNASLY